MIRLPLLLLIALPLVAGDEVVMLLDISNSVAPAFEINVSATGQSLAALPDGACVTVLAVTRASFRAPKFLIRRTCIGVADYATDSRPTVARQQLAHHWRDAVEGLHATEPVTDIVGALHYAAWLLEEYSGSRRWIAVWTDARNTSDPNLNTLPGLKKAFAALPRGSVQLPRLAGVQIVMVGVDTIGRDPQYMAALRDFWTQYLNMSGGALVRFSPQPEWTLSTVSGRR